MHTIKDYADYGLIYRPCPEGPPGSRLPWPSMSLEITSMGRIGVAD